MNVTYPTPQTVNEVRRRTLDDPYGTDAKMISISHQQESPYPVTQIKQRSMTNFYSKAYKKGNNSILREIGGAKARNQASSELQSDNAAALFPPDLAKGDDFIDKLTEIDDFKTKADSFYRVKKYEQAYKLYKISRDLINEYWINI